MPVEPFGDEPVDFVTPPEPTTEELDQVEVMWMERLARPWRPTAHRPFRATRCTGVVRSGPRQGRQCPHPSVLGTHVCQVHGAQLPSVRQAANRRTEEARIRLIHSADKAVDWLLDLGENAGSDAVRLGAAKEVLDRAGVRGGVEVNVTVEQVSDPASLLREKLATLRKRTEETVVEGSVVDTAPASPAGQTELEP